MNPSKKQKSFLKPCSASVKKGAIVPSQSGCGAFLGLNSEEIKECVIVILSVIFI